MKFPKSIVAVFFLTVVSFPAVFPADRPLPELSGDPAEFRYQAPPSQRWLYSDPSPEKKGERYEDVYEIQCLPDGDGYAVVYNTRVGRLNLSLDSRGMLRSYEQSISSAFFKKKAGFDFQSVKVEGEKILVKTSLDGVTKKNLSKPYGPGIIDMDCMGYSLQALLLGGKEESFRTKVHVGSGECFSCRFELLRSDDPLSLAPAFEYPAALKQSLIKGHPYCVYIFSLEGPPSIFYPYKWYMVFDQSRDDLWCACWGGKENEAQYRVLLPDGQ